jgi:DNA-directed RNA polymerase subunit RPC12/RpoP
MAEFKFACAQCGQHIQCDTSYAGMQIDCPVCQQSIVVPPPPRAAADAVTSAAVPTSAKKSRMLKNILLVIAAVFVLAALIIGGWFGYSKIRIHKLPPGLVALWPGEGNAKDSLNGHNATVSSGMTYTPAKIGMGFNFVGPNDTISVPASTALDVGNGAGYTLACWIAPVSVAVQEPLIEWSQGAHLWISVNYAGVGGEGCIYANIIDTHGGYHIFASPTGIVHPNTLQYVSLTYDKVSGLGKIYYNGSLVASSNLGNFTPKTDTALLIGQRIDGDFHYEGIVDEISLYNRALADSEIQKIYAAQK